MNSKESITRFFLLVLLGLFSSCVSDNEVVVKGKILKLKYVGEVKEDEWIEIDGYRLIHKDIYAFYTDPIHIGKDSLALRRTIDEFEKDVYITTTRQRQYLPEGMVWRETVIDNKIMAYDLFTRLVVKIRSIDAEAVNNYEFRNDARLLYAGELIMRRRDGKEISVKTSMGYAISIEILESF